MLEQTFDIQVKKRCTDILCFTFRKTIIERVFQIVVTFCILYIITFSVKLEIGVNFSDWGVRFPAWLIWNGTNTLLFISWNRKEQFNLCSITAPKKSSSSSKWLNGSIVWTQWGQYQVGDILYDSLSSLTHVAWCLELQFLHCTCLLKDCTFSWHVLHIELKTAMTQINIEIKFTDIGHMEYRVTYR